MSKKPLAERIKLYRKELLAKLKRYEMSDFACPLCQSKLDSIQRESRRLEYICSNEGCQASICFDKPENQWYIRMLKPIDEPKTTTNQKPIPEPETLM